MLPLLARKRAGSNWVRHIKSIWAIAGITASPKMVNSFSGKRIPDR